jgi:hypothetical protein
MTEYMCSVCNYKYKQKESAIKHVNSKKQCGTGEKSIIEIYNSIQCDGCCKNFSTKKTLNHHKKYICSNIIKKQFEELKTKIENLEKRDKISNTDNSNCNNNNMIVLNNYEDTDITKLSDETIYSLLKNSESKQLIAKFVEKFHFNKDMPENQNVYISNINDKYIKVYRNDRWELMRRKAVLDNVLIDIKYYLGKWVEENGKEFPDANEKFTKYLYQKESEQKKIIELVMYNNRYMIIH